MASWHHFLNCLCLTFVPVYIVYVSTALREVNKKKSLMWVGVACTASQFAQMVLLATFIPHSQPTHFEFTEEFMKATIGMLEILAMGITYHTPALRGEHKVLVLGLGWSCAESLLKRAAPMWLGAQTGEFDSRYAIIAIEGNLSLVIFMAFARLISRYNARDADSTTRVTLTALALVHASCNSNTYLFQPEILNRWMALALRSVWAIVVWIIAHKFYTAPRAKR